MSADDDRRERYLWDPGATPDPEVQGVERSLASARFDSSKHRLQVPLLPSRGVVRFRTTIALAAAAVAVIAMSATAWWYWRWTWTAGAAWSAEIASVSGQSAPVRTALAVDRPLQLPQTSSARIDIARIGKMQVAPGSAVTLTETSSTRHRVDLDRGAVSVRIWSPPGMFAFRTPAGIVRDLGCIFDLNVDGEGTARLAVDTGWVQMDNDFGESLVPAGASAVMRRVSRPGVPVYRDASDVFLNAVRAAEDGGDATERRELDTIVRTARRHDVLTLLMLANVSPIDIKRTLLTRAAELRPPPATVSVAGIVGGDRDQLWVWHNALDLPPVKSWWHNWRDAFR